MSGRKTKIKVGDEYQDKLGNRVVVSGIDTTQRVTFRWEDGYERVQQSSAIILNRIMREEDSRAFSQTIKVGDKFTTKQGAVVEVVEYITFGKIRIKFFDDSFRWVSGGNLKKGFVWHKDYPSNSGVGRLGTDSLDIKSMSYGAWSGMLKRVYNPKEGRQAINYAKCSVDETWKVYDTFRTWYDSQIKEEGFQLDKDLLHKGNLMYCPDFCVLIPREINVFLTNRANQRGPYPVGITYHPRLNKYQATCNVAGKSEYLGVYYDMMEAFKVYKARKELYAKELAAIWLGRIDQKAYEALINFEVSLGD
ncbi:DUF4222 domain-containing protein [Candidatus Dependentiae bacterium]|nr:MAG: DUF4222 domain-containing protein [Candidatus Dependentiae bacterium]